MDDPTGLRPMGTQLTELLDGGAQTVAVTLVVTAHLPLRALPGLVQGVGRVQGDRAEILTIQHIGPAHPSWPPVIETKTDGPPPALDVDPLAGVTPAPPVPSPAPARRRKET